MAATYRRRLGRAAAMSAVAALALAALTASQAPAATRASAQERDTPPPADATIDGGSPYYTDLPPLNSPVPPRGSDRPGDADAATGPAEAGIPATVLAAYKKAESAIGASDPGCRLPWQLLAGIGKVESGQARGGAVDAAGTTLRPIRGPQLNGHGFARITDTDGGVLDGDRTHDRAVGPMQFIPSTWSSGGADGTGWGADGNGDGKKDPDNVFDAALAAGHYLCNGARDLSAQQDLDRAILGYNNSGEYLRTVLSWFAFYRNGTHEVPDGKGVLPVHRGGSRGGGAADDGGASRPGKGSGGAKDTRPDSGGKGDGHGPGTGKPGTPDEARPPAGSDGSGGSNGPGSQPPAPEPTPTPTPTPTPEQPAEPAPLTALTRVGDKDLTATAGTDFTASPQVRAEDAAGKPVEGAAVRFTLTGDTGARFPDGAREVTVRTGKDGLARAPELHAGDRPGAFTVRATAVGREVAPVDFGATVKAAPAPRADTLARTSDKKLTATAGKGFADDAVEVRATYRGKAVADVEVTATMVTDGAKPVENDKGPYFTAPAEPGATPAEQADAEPLRTLKGLRTDADGLLKLPKIHTDSRTGTFLLRLTTADGAHLTVELNVAAPAAP